MDETTLRRLAEQLLAELPERIPDPTEREAVDDGIGAALASLEGQGRQPLLDALSAHPATRAWMREHTDVRYRGGLLGQPMTPLGLYYVCPHEDEDAILLSVPAKPPLCSVHGVPMTLQG